MRDKLTAWFNSLTAKEIAKLRKIKGDEVPEWVVESMRRAGITVLDANDDEDRGAGRRASNPDDGPH